VFHNINDEFALLNYPVDSPMTELEALRASSSSPFTPRSSISQDSDSSQESVFASLVKYVPSRTPRNADMEQVLTDFYINGVCPGRTVATQSKTYVSLLQMSSTCLSTRYALLSLAASYIREYFPAQKDAYHQAELYYSTQSLQALAMQISEGQNYGGALATSMLLMHHGALNQSDSPLCWSCHANVFDVIPSEFIDHHSDPALFIRTQLVLARTAQLSKELQDNPPRSFETINWLEGALPTETTKISGTLGLSPQLVFLISSVTLLATNPSRLNKLMYAQLQETQLQSLQQWTSEPRGPGHDVLVATAESFRLATLIYLRCRLYGYMARRHPLESLANI
jgi:hypothetical protein